MFNTGGGKARIYPQAAPSSVSPTNDAFLSVQKKNVLDHRETELHRRAHARVLPADARRRSSRAAAGSSCSRARPTLAVQPALGKYRWLTSAKNKAKSPRPAIHRGCPTPSRRSSSKPGARPSYSSFSAFQNRILQEPAHAHFERGDLHAASTARSFTMFLDTGACAADQRQPTDLRAAARVQQPVHEVDVGLGQDHDQASGHRARPTTSAHSNAPEVAKTGRSR